MKKIIAVAVATAFVAPVFAGDVTVSGDIEYILTDASKTNGTANSYGDSDIFVTVTETLDNGLTISLKQGWEDIGAGSGSAGTGDTELTIGGLPFGSVTMGMADPAAAMYDEAAGVAEAGGGFADYSADDSGEFVLRADLATGIEGLSASISADFDNKSDTFNVDTSGYSASGTSVTMSAADSHNSTENVVHMSYALNYAFAGGNVFWGTTELGEESGDTALKNPSVYGANFTAGPFFIGYQAGKNLTKSSSSSTGITAVQDTNTMGITYNYGPGKVFMEQSEAENETTSSKKETIYGISYKMGPLNTYVQQEAQNVNRGDDDITYVGVEYAF
jgi:hypothetical protein